MAGRIPDETLQAIRERVSIVEVVSGYVSLRKAGKNHLGLCPFHSEKTPSFTVSDERGLFHCFGCGAGGTVFTFLMRIDRIEFPEAVEVLARRAGVALPKRVERGDDAEQRQELIHLNEVAQHYFHDSLQSAAGAAARQYLAKRGLSAAIIERYGVGFCPATRSGLVRLLAEKRLAPQKAIELGLVGRRSDGGLYDRLWGRVTFPIRHRRGHILGFGGRTLGTEHPKYLNSPESPLFHKGRVLYGLFEARDAIREAGRVLIVEGYLDAIALADAGIGYAVASLGTAFTAAQLELVRPFADEVVACFDGDRAGREAAVRAFGVCVDAKFWGLGAFLPEGFDPDSYVRAHGRELTEALLHTAKPLAEFFIEHVDPGPAATVPERTRAARKIGEIIARLRDPVQFSLLAKQAAQRLGVDETIFGEMRLAAGTSRPVRPGAPPPVGRAEVFRPEEATLVEAMALDCEVAVLVAHRGVLDAFLSPELADAGRSVVAAWEREQSNASAIDRLPAALGERVTAGLLGEGPMAAGDRLQVARDCIERIERRTRRSEARALLAKLRAAEAGGTEARYQEELRRHNELLRGKEVGRV